MRPEGFLRSEVPRPVLWGLIVMFAFLAGDWLQARVLLNHDVAWITHSARWLLHGREFGSDVLDPTPPMAWLLSMPAAALANSGLLQEPVAVRVVFWGYSLAATALLFATTSLIGSAGRGTTTGWRIGMILSITLVAGHSFGQREFVSVAFAMPYAATIAVRLQRQDRIRWPLGLMIGALAGIGFAIKPFFLAVPLLLETTVLLKYGWRAIWRPETLAIVVVIVVDVACVVVLAPQFLTLAIPLIRSTYWAYVLPDFSTVLQRYVECTYSCAAGILIALVTRTWSTQHTVVGLTLIGYSVSYFVQRKGFVYHGFPVLMASIVFLAICLGAGLHGLSERLRLAAPFVRAVVIVGLTVVALVPASTAASTGSSVPEPRPPSTVTITCWRPD